jgi:hypothetical protein
LNTYVLHLTDSVNYWILLQYPVFMGINDDPVDCEDQRRNAMIAGGRVYEIGQIQAELASNPPYIQEQAAAPSWMAQPPAVYVEIFSRGRPRLFRRRDP